MTLEQQLAEAAARVAAAEAALAEAKAKVADRMDAAVAAETEASRVYQAASDAVDAAESNCDRRLHLTVPQRNAPRQYHPDLLAAAARIIGVAWENRATVRPGNNSKDIYDAALFAYVQRRRATDPALRAAREAPNGAKWGLEGREHHDANVELMRWLVNGPGAALSPWARADVVLVEARRLLGRLQRRDEG